MYNRKHLKKIYSIWICMDAPGYIGNAISEYRFSKYDVVQGIPDRPQAYDKQTMILICLNEKQKVKNRLNGILNVLLSPTLPAEEKREKLEKTYGIKMDETLEEEVRQMCNLSEWVLETGIRQGRSEGRKQGRKQGETRMLKLIARMTEAGELESLTRLGKDRKLLEEMYEKYQV